ncbi:hypothetical protein H6G89_14460 [Oscillatoria sp. FACHB-1407]|uniref:TMEM14 family protein n=1 Tax=Oscillatoria sp. FACHB-1407 TaxID=2692847 RepID=UPI0016852110|nr:TMEM14 family protein [Oscillatoria sp. FACHB-1407]MBD2462247.1 hypothetical protein [Oscillatoria sp. FACHB-1407]
MIGIIAAIAYGILALVGGIIGYAQAKSKMSLISGVISGVLLILCGVAQFRGVVWAGTLAAVITAVLIVVFVMRLTKTRKFMPAGLMAIAGGVALAALVADAFV